jgi:SulP family sulfate permease
LIVVAAALAASLTLHLEERGVAVVGKFPGGLPVFKFPVVTWREIHVLLPAAVGIALVTYTEGILLARAFAAKNGYEVNANQELSAFGLADVLTGLFQGFSVTGSQARTTISDNAGGKTQLVSLVAAAALALFLLFFTSCIARLPVVALAVILIYGAFTLVEFHSMKRIYRFYPKSGLLAALTTLGVLAVGVAPGILVGVAFSLMGLINRLSPPPDAVLSQVPGNGFHDLGKPAEAQTLPGLIAYRFYAPLFFSNASHFALRVREIIAAAPSPPRWFLLDAQAITDIDVTAAEMLHSLNHELKAQGIALKIAHVNWPFRQILERTGLARELGQESFFSSVHECVAAFNREGAGH